ncbi:hypothetical protein HPL003_21380 [Paenibacillus terrae HPL-003]|uniref:Uncharacterized protein n=1 Tax=Paenibacillus terrae (strain HPL-003) TaxID=985665 RepID=G7VPK8_PAETH|nr:hypothetical protein HPL003_21380 [Paenibacillus terrae HPL-003]
MQFSFYYVKGCGQLKKLKWFIKNAKVGGNIFNA